MYDSYMNRLRSHSAEVDRRSRPEVKMGDADLQRLCRLVERLDVSQPGAFSLSDVSGGQLLYSRDPLADRQLLELNGGGNVSTGPRRDQDKDTRYLQEFELKQKQPSYKKMQEARQKLPSYRMAEDILRKVESNPVTVISGDTGCGKTTQVAQFILDDYIKKGQGSMCHVICTQPRRISAMSVAQRVAAERGELCGEAESSVGYQIRFDVRRPRSTGSILYCTTGVVFKYLESDPDLSLASHIILDEIHERDIHSDFLMILMKQILPRRPDLKVILMSATLNSQLFSQYYNQCPIINIQGRNFPIEEFFLEDVVEMLSYQPPSTMLWRGPNVPRNLRFEHTEFLSWLIGLRGFSQSTTNALKLLKRDHIDIGLMAQLIRHISTRKAEGAILVFMPGWDEISQLHEALMKQQLFQTDRYNILLVHGTMTMTDQQEIFERAPPGVRKIVIATNIAETSITIDDVVYVIDSGKVKLTNYDPRKNVTTLQAEWNSKANSKQRKGRAGRVQAGVCYCMYTKYQHQKLKDAHPPEMKRTRLENLCLQIKILNCGKIKRFFEKAMEPPLPASSEKAIELLTKLNALDANEELTPLGYNLARMPVDPHIAKMILYGAIFSCLDPILTIAACLDHKEPFYVPTPKLMDEVNANRKKLSQGSYSDHLMYVNTYQRWWEAKQYGNESKFCHENFVKKNVLDELKKMRKQFAQLLHDLGFITSTIPNDAAANYNSGKDNLLRGIISAALYPNVAKVYFGSGLRLGGSSQTLQVDGGTDGDVELHRKCVAHSTNIPYPWMVFYRKMKMKKELIFDATGVTPYQLLFFGGSLTTRSIDGDTCLVMDRNVIIRAAPPLARAIKSLRDRLDCCLIKKVNDPKPVEWMSLSSEDEVMRKVVELIDEEK